MAFDDDKKILGEILGYTDKLLEELTNKVKTEQARFKSAWKEVKASLQGLTTKMANISNEGDEYWGKLKENGLTGTQLTLKRALLVIAATNGVGKILKLLNIILGSIPGADAIKEFKELLEDNLEDPEASVNAKFP
jgi:hypothetical protein